MKRVLWTMSAMMAAAVTPAAAQDRPTPEQVARVMELMQPGPEHRAFMNLAGEWDQEIRYWAEPGAEPMVSRGRSESRVTMGGRFLESRSTAEMMGQPMESLWIFGFDRRHGTYTTVGFDTMGTYYVTAAGKPGPESNVIRMSGRDEDPAMGHTQIYDFVVRIDGTERWSIEVIFHDAMHTRGKGPVKVMELIHTRRGS